MSEVHYVDAFHRTYTLGLVACLVTVTNIPGSEFKMLCALLLLLQNE